VEHLVFKGTRSFSASELARKVDGVGGDLNAWTDREEMAFACTVPAEHWRTAVEVLTELCFEPTFPEGEFEREKEVIRNEILATLEDPEEMAFESYLSNADSGLWTRPVAGTAESLAGLLLPEVLRWHDEHLTPGRASIVAAGCLDVEALLSLLQTELPTTHWRQEPADLEPETSYQPKTSWRVVGADFQMVQLMGGWNFPKPASLREATVWQIFSMLWGETMSSRLFQTLREQKGLCYSVSSQIFDTDSAWELQFFTTGAPEHSRVLVVALRDEIRRLVSEPPTPQEWEDARRALHGGMILGSERMENRVGRLWRHWQSYGVEEPFEHSLAALERPVTIEEQRSILGVLLSQAASLQVWGKTRLTSSRALESLWRP
jgi:predicted Zn-dependent peptidase